jgi:Zn-dependent M28 family amino/carboxypeptidase
VISAHYDHLGRTISGETYYGASDNASGTACILAMAKYFKQHPHPCSLIFAAFDREETGMIGSFSFMREATASGLSLNIKFNLNVDMIARNDKNEIFACGIRYYPSFAYLIKETQNKTNVKLLMGHDTGNNRDDWTNQSDHLAFHRKGIPFLYIGVEDHPDYHKTTDTYDKIDLGSYIENCNMVTLIAEIIKP